MNIKDNSESLLSQIGKLLGEVSKNEDQRMAFVGNKNVDMVSVKLGDFITKGRSFGAAGLFNNGNFWISRNNSYAVDYSPAFNLGPNITICSGGSNYAGYPHNAAARNDTRCFTDSSNTWTTRATMINRVYGHSASGITSNIGMISFGKNTSTVYSTSYSYTYSTNVWAVRFSNPSMSRLYGPATPMTSNRMFLCCGYVPGSPDTLTTNTMVFNYDTTTIALRGWSNHKHTWGCFGILGATAVVPGGLNSGMEESEKYNDNTTSWINTTPAPVRTMHGVGAFSLSGETGAIVGGGNDFMLLKNTQKYISSTNSWESKNEMTVSSTYASTVGGFYFGGNGSAGFDGHQVSIGLKYIDSNFMAYRPNTSQSIFIQNSDLDMTENNIVETATLVPFTTTNPIHNILVASAFTNISNVLTYGISLDNGAHWKDGNTVGKLADTSGLPPSMYDQYNLKLRFQLEQYVTSNVWTTKANAPTWTYAGVGIGLTSDIGISTAGVSTTSVSPYPPSHITNQYTRSSNSWAQRVNFPNSSYRGSGFLSYFDRGYVVGGYEYATETANKKTCRYQHSVNTWIQQSDAPCALYEVSGLTMTSESGIQGGGFRTASNAPADHIHVYYASRNTWAALTPSGWTQIYESVGMSLTSHVGLFCGGVNAAGNDTSLVQTYNLAANASAARATLPRIVDDLCALSFTTDIGIVFGGHGGSNFNQTIEYSYSKNCWINTTSLPLTTRQHSSDMSMNAFYGVTAGGHMNYYTTLEFTRVDTNLYNFIVTDFNGAKLCQ